MTILVEPSCKQNREIAISISPRTRAMHAVIQDTNNNEVSSCICTTENLTLAFNLHAHTNTHTHTHIHKRAHNHTDIHIHTHTHAKLHHEATPLPKSCRACPCLNGHRQADPGAARPGPTGSARPGPAQPRLARPLWARPVAWRVGTEYTHSCNLENFIDEKIIQSNF